MKTRSKINLMISTLAAIALGCVIGCDKEGQLDEDLAVMVAAPAPKSINYTIPEWGVRFGSVDSIENYPIWTINAANFVYDKASSSITAQTSTNIARQIVRDAVANVNVNLQSAEDTRVALTNLITILKNL